MDQLLGRQPEPETLFLPPIDLFSGRQRGDTAFEIFHAAQTILCSVDMKESLRAAARSLRKRWWRRGFTLNSQRDPPGRKWATHEHVVDEIVYLVDGALAVHRGQKVYRSKERKEMIIPRLTPHSLSNPGRRQAGYLYGFRTKK